MRPPERWKREERKKRGKKPLEDGHLPNIHYAHVAYLVAFSKLPALHVHMFVWVHDMCTDTRVSNTNSHSNFNTHWTTGYCKYAAIQEKRHIIIFKLYDVKEWEGLEHVRFGVDAESAKTHI